MDDSLIVLTQRELPITPTTIKTEVIDDAAAGEAVQPVSDLSKEQPSTSLGKRKTSPETKLGIIAEIRVLLTTLTVLFLERRSAITLGNECSSNGDGGIGEKIGELFGKVFK